MRWRSALLSAVLMAGSAVLIFHFFQRQLSVASFAFGTHPDVRRQLELSLEDQKKLARLDPEAAAAYRLRFEELEMTSQRLRILDHSRGDLVRRYETLLLVLLAGTVLLVAGVWAVRQTRDLPRLERLQRALEELAGGRTDLELGDRRRDTLGRIAAMVERTSKVMARDRRRLAALQNLSAWQEAARRHAHEMRTPLTGAQLELARIEELAIGESCAPSSARSEQIRKAARGAAEELARLNEFTRHFTSFARLPSPQLRVWDLRALIEEFVTTFDDAWPNLRLTLEPPAAGAGGAWAAVDRDMVRQVLVNLCDNSSQALAAGAGAGAVRFTLSVPATRKAPSHQAQSQAAPSNEAPPSEAVSNDEGVHLEIADDGPGIVEGVRSRLFEPYTTTRTIGEGMGLGLAICKKILLDHGGDLELARSSPAGTTFRLTFPSAEAAPTATGSDTHHDQPAHDPRGGTP